MAYKLLVTHVSPDLDAVTSVWLLKKFDKQHFGEAEVDFLLAGERFSESELEKRGVLVEEVEYVDTGKSRFDHHTSELANKRVCGASLVLEYLKNLHPELEEDEALHRLVEHVVEIDHFGEVDWPEPNNKRYLFSLFAILRGLKTVGGDDIDVVEFGIKALDAVYALLRARVEAEEEVRKKGIEFETVWGKGLGIEGQNDEVIKYAQKEGYVVVVRKDPEVGNVRIKALPNKKVDLTRVYEKIMDLDGQASWYFHPARTMLINGSSKGDHRMPSSLSLHQVIEILKETQNQDS